MVLDALHSAGLGPEGAAFWLILAALLWACLIWRYLVIANRHNARLNRELAEVREALAATGARADEADRLAEALSAAHEKNAGLSATMAALEARLEERERALRDLKERLDGEFRASAARMLDMAHEAFLKRANETFARHQESASADAERKRRALDELIRPMSETLQRYEKGLGELRAEQHKQRGELIGRIGDLARSANDVRLEAQKLSTALRAGPKTRGRWGEEQLRNVVETAGMSSYVDFIEQAHIADGDQRKQPDMVVNLPGGRKIAVDSKVSLGAYLDAVEAEDDAARHAHFLRHADDLWAHVKTLAARDYAVSLRESLDVVIMFVPGENYFAAAVEARPELFQDAFERKVLIATPTTLVAILKAASFNWRQEKAAENAVRVAAMASDLYDSLRVMSGHLGDVGKALDRAVSKYNSAVAGMERRVLPRARRFADYELPGIDKTIDPLEPLDAHSAQLTHQSTDDAPEGTGEIREPDEPEEADEIGEASDRDGPDEPEGKKTSTGAQDAA